MRRAAFLDVLFPILLAGTILGAHPILSIAQASERTTSDPLVLLVRHAEKVTEPADDPSLSAKGIKRAQALATALRDAGVTAVITTELRRTRDTAQPLAKALGLKPEVVPARGRQAGTHAEAVAEAVRRHMNGVVLVVGHSNTIPLIIHALGGPLLPKIGEAMYANLFVLIPWAGEMRLVRSRYGAVDSEPSPDSK